MAKQNTNFTNHNNTIITDKTGQVYRIVERIDVNSFILKKEKDFRSTIRQMMTDKSHLMSSQADERTVLYNNIRKSSSYVRSVSEAMTVARVNQELGLLAFEPGMKPHMIP